MAETSSDIPLATPNFFEALDLPVRLNLDSNDLEKRYHALSRTLHPDYHQQGSASEQRYVLEKSAILNQAFRALRDPSLRAEHLLSLYRPGAEKGADKGETPKALLMTVFELQELVEEADGLASDASSDERNDLKSRIEEIEEQLDARAAAERIELEKVANDWDALARDEAGQIKDASQREALLDRIGALLNERAYMRRLRGNIAQVVEKLEA